MFATHRFVPACICLLLSSFVFAQDQPEVNAPSVYAREADRPKTGDRIETVEALQMVGAKVEVYQSFDDVQLNMYLFYPPLHEGNESRSCIVFFFGGGWRNGSPQQFEQHCRYLASRGIVAMTADYRVLSRHETKAKECVMDAKSAIRWVRKNARRLGVDPDRIIAAGGSAGGHIAACTATAEGFENPTDDQSISSKPNGLVLFNPALVLDRAEGLEFTDEKMASLTERIGVRPAKLSPFHQLPFVRDRLPPTIIFHGKADTTVAYQSAEMFATRASAQGNDVLLVGYEDQPHVFFNFGRNENKFYLATMGSLDSFLVDHGLLEGPSPKQVKIISAAAK